LFLVGYAIIMTAQKMRQEEAMSPITGNKHISNNYNDSMLPLTNHD